MNRIVNTNQPVNQARFGANYEYMMARYKCSCGWHGSRKVERCPDCGKELKPNES